MATPCISVDLSIEAGGCLDALAAGGNRSALVRGLIAEDFGEIAGVGLHDRHLATYRSRPGSRRRGRMTVRVAIDEGSLLLVRERCRRLGFSVAEYIVALLRRAQRRKGVLPSTTPG